MWVLVHGGLSSSDAVQTCGWIPTRQKDTDTHLKVHAKYKYK